MRACVRGYAGLERFTALLNLPRPVTQSNSVIKNKLRYTELFSDGDSKSYISINDTYGLD